MLSIKFSNCLNSFHILLWMKVNILVMGFHSRPISDFTTLSCVQYVGSYARKQGIVTVYYVTITITSHTNRHVSKPRLHTCMCISMQRTLSLGQECGHLPNHFINEHETWMIVTCLRPRTTVAGISVQIQYKDTTNNITVVAPWPRGLFFSEPLALE